MHNHKHQKPHTAKDAASESSATPGSSSSSGHTTAAARAGMRDGQPRQSDGSDGSDGGGGGQEEEADGPAPAQPMNPGLCAEGPNSANQAVSDEGRPRRAQKRVERPGMVSGETKRRKRVEAAAPAAAGQKQKRATSSGERGGALRMTIRVGPEMVRRVEKEDHG